MPSVITFKESLTLALAVIKFHPQVMITAGSYHAALAAGWVMSIVVDLENINIFVQFVHFLYMNTTRASDIRLGVRIEVISILWMVIEMAVSILAGIAAKSVLLTAFGLDSLIELVSGAVLLWRLSTESRGEKLKNIERSERLATWAVAITLGLLCIYVLVSSAFGLVSHAKPEGSWLGIGISAAALLIMPSLAVSKRRISKRINSAALAGDAANSITCASMAATVLVGLLLNSLFGLWWAEYVAALVFLAWLIKETLEVFEEAVNKKEPAGRE